MDPFRIEEADGVVTFTLGDGANGNQITGSMFDAMVARLRAEEQSPRARVLRIRAEGAAFCTGRERTGRGAASIQAECARLIEMKRLLRMSPLITIAEVQGDALGFGFGMAIVCDFAIVADHVRLGFPEMKMGLPPSAIMTYLGDYALPRHAFPLVLFGDPIPAADAARIGLISESVPRERLRSHVDTLVERILALDQRAASNCKQFFQAALQSTFDQNCRVAVDALTVGSLAVLSGASHER